MKKFLLVIMAMTMLVLSACGSDEKKEAPVSKPVEKICTTAGLGDGSLAWIQTYGESNKKIDGISPVTFDNGRYITLFLEDKAINITVTGKDGKMVVDTNAMLPKDSKKIKSEEIPDDQLIKTKDTYTSEALKKAVPANDGTFVVITNYDKQTGKYINTVLNANIKVK